MLTKDRNSFAIFVIIITSLIFLDCLKITSSVLRLRFIQVESYPIKTLYDPYDIEEVLLNLNKSAIYYTDGTKYANVEAEYEGIYNLTLLKNGQEVKFTHDGRLCISSKALEYMTLKREHYLWSIPAINAVFAEVSKNACSAVLATIINVFNRSGTKIEKDSSHNSLWLNIFGLSAQNGIISTTNARALHTTLKKATVFLVYDDPVDRFLRTVNDKLLGHEEIASILTPPKTFDKKSLSTFVDKMILVTRMDMTSEQGWDQHLAPITTGFPEDVIDRVTDFVYLKDLDRFMMTKFKIKQGHFHVTKKKKPFTRDMLTERQLREIKKLYKKDYEIPKKYSERFFK